MHEGQAEIRRYLPGELGEALIVLHGDFLESSLVMHFDAGIGSEFESVVSGLVLPAGVHSLDVYWEAQRRRRWGLAEFHVAARRKDPDDPESWRLGELVYLPNTAAAVRRLTDDGIFRQAAEERSWDELYGGSKWRG